MKKKEERYTEAQKHDIAACAEYVYVKRLEDAGGNPNKLEDGEAAKRSKFLIPVLQHAYDFYKGENNA